MMAKKLTAEQEQVVGLLLEGKAPAEAAEMAGIDMSKVRGWLSGNTLFAARLNAQRQEIWDANVAQLRGLAGKAITTLGELLDHNNPSIQLRTAGIVLKSVSLTQIQAPDAPVTRKPLNTNGRVKLFGRLFSQCLVVLEP
jgi:hypothetical protein